MPIVLAFAAHFHVVPLAPDQVFLVTENRSTLLQGRLYFCLASLIGTGATRQDIGAQMSGEFGAQMVDYALNRLVEKGYLREADTRRTLSMVATWHALGIEPAVAEARLASRPLRLLAVGSVALGAAAESLESMGVRLDTEAACTLALTDDYLRPELAEINAEALATGRPWIVAKTGGMEPWLGPLFVPNETGCWECLAQRLRFNREVEGFLASQSNGTGIFPALAAMPGSVGAASDMLACAVAHWLAIDALPRFHGRVITLDAPRCRTREHELVRLASCSSCAVALPKSQPAAPLLADLRGPTATALDGNYRACSPQETLARFQHHVSPITGVIKRLDRATLSHAGVISIYWAGHNMAHRLPTLGHLQANLRSSSSGKGISDDQAKVSAICEALERYSGVFEGTEFTRMATARELGDAAILPASCLLFSEAQYRDRERLNAGDPGFHWVPERFDVEAPVHWTPAWSLDREQQVWIPTAICYFQFESDSGVPVFALADSNGSAAGNSLGEAVVQGFCELVERDAAAIWWYNRLRRPAVDMASFADSRIDALITHHATLGRELWALDLTHDLGVPTFAAVSRHVGGPTEALMLGLGCHFDARIALTRALTEANQMVARLDLPLNDAATLHWVSTARLADHPYLAAGPGTRIAADFAGTIPATLDELLSRCRACLAPAGLEMLVLDQTRADIGLPVVKVFVPGLRHFWARFAPGRLYDVPVALGWLAEPTREEELNPIGCML